MLGDNTSTSNFMCKKHLIKHFELTREDYSKIVKLYIEQNCPLFQLILDFENIDKKGDKLPYLGGKSRLSKDISNVLNSNLKEEQTFVDLFCGSCNVIEKIKGNRIRIANDKHKYLIEMWKAIQNGWIPPNDISEEEYKYIRENKNENMALTSFVGFGCSFAGKWFGGYARSNDKRNYAKMAKNSLNKKIINLYNWFY